MENTVIKIGGMSCQGCVKNITGVLVALPGVSAAEVSLEAGEARVSFDPQAVSRPVTARGDLASDLLQAALAREQVFPRPNPAAPRETIGWLEVQWETAPAVLLADMREGVVPETHLGDAFLLTKQ